METKICTKCKKELPIEDFNWREKSKGTRRSECKYCHTEYMKQAYKNKNDLVANIKSNISCKKCGEINSYMLDFHHLDPSKKETTVARMISNAYRIDRILDEISKCIVLCSNCHREFHYLEENYGLTIDEYLSNEYELNVY